MSEAEAARGEHWPVVIAGGGLAGCAAATRLAQRGQRVLLLERDSFPRDKMCGEFLSGESRRVLAELGCLEKILRFDPPDISNVRFVSRRGRELVIALPAPALGISRRALDQVLFEHAEAAGVKGLAGTAVEEIVRPGQWPARVSFCSGNGEGVREVSAGLVMAAYGRRSKLDRDLKRTFLDDLDMGVGIKLHHTVASGSLGEAARAGLDATVEVYALDGGYCGIAPVEAGQVNVCMLLSRATFSRLATADWPRVSDFLAAESGALGRRLAGLAPVAGERPLTVSHMPFSKREPWCDGVMFLGDAAGMIAPLCGDGMAMAMESGVMAADCVLAGGDVGDRHDAISPRMDVGERWALQWRSRFRTRLAVGRVLQDALFSPVVAEGMLLALKAGPRGLPELLARITRG